MAENSGISWTDHTFNPWIGCTKVSPACKHCYAERDMDHRFGKVQWGPTGTRSITSDANWLKPLKWNKEAGENGIRYRVFCASLADVFENWTGPIIDHKGKTLRISEDGRITDCTDWTRPLTIGDVRQRLFNLIDATPNLDWLLLTKRPENIKQMIELIRLDGGTTGRLAELDIDTPAHRYYRRNVWLGCSVENQEYADKRIPDLLKCRDLSPVLFLSCEPLLGPVNFERIPIKGYNLPHLDVLRKGCWPDSWLGFTNSHNAPSIDWVIAGGESGPNARPSHPDWFRSMRDHCQAASITFHFKQWGEWLPQGQGAPPDDWHDESKYAGKIVENDLCIRVGVKVSGRLLDGVLHNEFPEIKTNAN